MSRRTIVLVTVLAMALTATLASPARAGEAARHCDTYYHHNDRSTGWGFTVCVKLLHDPSLHAWSTAASVHSSTPGVVLHLLNARVFIDGTAFAVSGPESGVGFISNDRPDFWRCWGRVVLSGDALARVDWPNGLSSSFVTTRTRDHDPEFPDDTTIAGSC